jgi:hypothetical protein
MTTVKPRFDDPQSAQIAAHEAYLVALGELAEAEAAGDEAAQRRLRARVSQAKRHWHRLVQAATRAMRETRHQGGA